VTSDAIKAGVSIDESMQAHFASKDIEMTAAAQEGNRALERRARQEYSADFVIKDFLGPLSRPEWMVSNVMWIPATATKASRQIAHPDLVTIQERVHTDHVTAAEQYRIRNHMSVAYAKTTSDRGIKRSIKLC